MKLLEHFRAGFVAALPYLAMAIVVQVGGHLADYVRRRGILSTTATRKVTTSGGNLSSVREHIKALFTRNKVNPIFLSEIPNEIILSENRMSS